MPPHSKTGPAESDSDQDAVVIDRDDIGDYNPEQILPQSPRDIESIRSWLQPTSYAIAGGEFRKHLASHVPGTGAWVAASDEYRDWLNSDECGLLWIKGVPGSGKSVIAASLIDELSKSSSPECLVLYFFFRQIIDANHKPKALLCDWMDQVLHYSPPLQQTLLHYVKSHRDLNDISLETLWTDLRAAFASLPGKVFCVADALDEMDSGNDDFLQTLARLGQQRNVKVIITSRPVPRVEGPLRNIPCHKVRLQERLVDADIATYVQHVLSASNIPEDKWSVIQEAVPGRAKGLFLYARLAIDAFLERDVDVALSELPADLNALYTGLLKEHIGRSGVPASVQHLILQTVTHTTRPLRLLELAEMIRFRDGGTERDLKTAKELVRTACGPLLEILADETVSVIHHTLTEYLKGSTRTGGEVYSVLEPGSTNAQLATACLRYITAPGGCLEFVDELVQDNIKCQMGEQEESDKEVGPDDPDIYSLSRNAVSTIKVQLRLKYPFFDYATGNWACHIRRSEAAGHSQTDIDAAVDQLLKDDKHRRAWILLEWSEQGEDAENITPLHIAARSGLVQYTAHLVESMPADPVDAYGHSPLWFAAEEGHAKMIELLVATGADPAREDAIHGLSPLHQAARANHSEAVKVLLQSGVDPLTKKSKEPPGNWCGNAPTSIGHTALMYACDGGHLETVEVFLSFLRDKENDIETVHRALAWAVGGRGGGSGSLKLVDLILKHPGVDVNAKVSGDTPLFLACGCSNLEIIQSLVRAGADPNIDCEDSPDEFESPLNHCIFPEDYNRPQDTRFTCLHKLAARSIDDHDFLDQKETEEAVQDLQSMFSLLVEAGADIHQRHPSGETALHRAVRSPALTKLLLDAGADANALANDGCSPLHKSGIRAGSIALLVEQGHADFELRSWKGDTPLLCMASSFYSNSALAKLLEYQPNCNVQDSKGNTALHLALDTPRADEDGIPALLQAGADPNLRNHEGNMPLHLVYKFYSASNHDEKILRVLQAAGADIDAVDKFGRTLFFNLVSKNPFKDQEELTTLLQFGASPHIPDFRGRTCLHQVVKKLKRKGRDDRLELLLAQGLEPKAVDYSGNSLFHEIAIATLEDRFSIDGDPTTAWTRLEALGLDVHQENHMGRTPLHMLASENTRSYVPHPNQIQPIDYVISQTDRLGLNCLDHDGLAPLHIAVTAGCLNAKKLLDAGADPSVTTREGLTPLHIAARCRNSNVVGLLLDALRQSAVAEATAQPDMEETPTMAPVLGVDAESVPRDWSGTTITPLFYACRSGRPETVALLLEAGATFDMDTMLTACAEFAEEDRLWDSTITTESSSEYPNVPANKMKDVSRPLDIFERGTHENCRLEEILDMLYKHNAGLDGGPNQAAAVNKAQQLVHGSGSIKGYTANCIRFAKAKWSQNGTTTTTTTITTTQRSVIVAQPFIERLQDLNTTASLQALEQYMATHPDRTDLLFAHFLEDKQYRLIEELAHQGERFLPVPEEGGTDYLSDLVQQGLADLFDKVGTVVAESALRTGYWHAFGDETKPGLWLAQRDNPQSSTDSHDPVSFLLEAVRRDLPNLDIVKLLVEKFLVDMDEVHLEPVASEGPDCIPVDSPILYLAKGNSWWHVHQALPYLIEKGANLDVRNYKGQTPLHVSLGENYPYPGPFGREAAKMLIEAGADVNAVDNAGKSLWGADMEITRLRIKHGATVTAEALFAAIDARNSVALEALLSGGMSADIRRVPSGSRLSRKELEQQLSTPMGFLDFIMSTGRDEPEPHEEYPLFRAVASRKARSTGDSPDDDDDDEEENMRVVQVLLDHGADPFAKYLARNFGEDEDGISETPSIQVPKHYQECTVLHELMDKNKPVDNILLVPGLDVNHRDALGRTLLHVAALDKQIDVPKASDNVSARIGIFDHMLSLGADLEARDNFGRNVLHHLISHGGPSDGKDYDLFEKSLPEIMHRAPDLVNQPDGSGMTPLHYALSRGACRGNPEIATYLLQAGADSLAVANDGRTSLHILATSLCNEDLRALFEDLVARGVDPNARDREGQTPLFVFSRRSSETGNGYWQDYKSEKDSLVMLDRVKADFFARDNKGQGLLHVAASGYAHRFKLLMDKGLDGMLEDEDHRTPVDVAAAHGNKEILELFEKKN